MARRGQNGGPLRLRPSAGLKGATAIGLALATTAFAPYAAAGPKGGNVKAGAATISTAGGRTTINQQGQKVVIDWKSFDIDADEAVEFVQPGKGSIALNRVLGDLPTHIRGELLANGNVWIVNQHGITFHAGAAVDVGGLIATTADIADADFMAGNYRFDKPGAPGAKIINEGSITFGEAGLAAFVAPEVVNHGVIAGKMGKVVIAGQETFAVDLAGDGLWAFTMGDGASGAKATNTGKIHNPGGYILISAASAQGMVESQISIGGVVEAKSAEVKGGKIILSGDGAVEVTGTLDVSGAGSGETGGEIEITGDTVHLTPTAKLDARGEAGGGSVKVGGGYQGGGALETARRTLVSDGAEIDASVIGQVGDGGEVIVWADEISGFFGSIRATGGALGGDGGFAEVSGKQQLAFDGFVDLSAQNGLPGELLLDPTNIEIVAAAPGADDNELDGDESILFDDPAAGDLTISAAAVEAALDLNIVTLQATNDITVNAAVSSVSAYSLYMDAGNNIELNADLTIAGGLRLTANAAPYASGTGTIDASGGGALDSSFIVLSAGDDLALGEITASSYLTVTAGGAITQVVGQTLSVTGLSSFDADASDITLNEANDFQGAVSATGANVDLTDANSLELGEVSATTLDVVAGGAITQTATQKIAVMDVSDFDAGTSDITLAQANDFQGAVSANGANVDLTDENALELGAVSATALDVIAGGAIAQTATQTITVTDVSDFDAGTADITLTQANDFQGAVSATGANVDLTDDNALELGAVSATTLDVVAGGAITQTATQTVTVTDVSDFDAGTEDITLTQANDFQGAVSASGANVDLTDANALQLGAVSATTLDVVAGGAITQTATQTITVTDVSDIDAGVADITLTQANDFQGAVSASGANVDLADDNALEFGAVSATTLYVIAGGAITQTATQTITVADVSDIAAGTADITLAQANDFQGAVSASGANVDLTDANALELGAASVTTLDVIAGGAITQTATQTITVTDVSDFDAGTADITLTQANDFQGAVSATGANVDLTDDNSLELGVVYATTLDVVAGGAITQTATQTVTVTGASDFEAGTADITLTQANEFDGVVDANGAAISLTDADSIQLGAITATGALTVIAADAISDMAGSRISAGATTLTSTNYDAIVLDNTAESDLHILGEVRVDGGAATINEYDRVTLGVSTVRGDLTVRADDLDVAGAVSVASGTGTVIIKTHGGQLGLGDATGTGVYGETNNITNADVAYLSAGALRFEADTTGASLQTDNFDSGAAISRVEIDVDAVTFGVAGGTETFQNDLAIEVNTYVRQGAGGTLLVNGETSFAADGLEVTLANAGNDFGGSVSGDTGATTLTDLGALDLG
ncbi:MAG: filamentous hemagglutinin N-terminal domain-containing protein, partial [Pseudomonadota bacterium]